MVLLTVAAVFFGLLDSGFEQAHLSQCFVPLALDETQLGNNLGEPRPIFSSLGLLVRQHFLLLPALLTQVEVDVDDRPHLVRICLEKLCIFVLERRDLVEQRLLAALEPTDSLDELQHALTLPLESPRELIHGQLQRSDLLVLFYEQIGSRRRLRLIPRTVRA